MLKANNRKKIGLGLKHWRPLAVLAGLFILLFLFAGTAKAPASTIVINGHTFKTEYADTSAQQEKGLSGRASIGSDQAMLFRFQNSGRQCFWMKDMRFNLDIIWLNSAKKVVHIEPDLSPGTYPKNFCADNSQYVVEVKAGTAQQLGLQTDDIINF